MVEIGVLGTGTMGPQIAVALSAAGYQVLLYNYQNVEQADSKIRRLAKVYSRRDTTGTVRAEDLLSRIRLISELSTLSHSSIVIEAIVENLTIKQQLFAELDRLCASATVLASNTSSLPIEDIARGLKNPGRVIGIHFFNPVFETKLVEIISTPASSTECIDETLALVHSLNKVPILFPESCVNRLIIPMINEACHAYEQGVGRMEDIDLAMKSGANHPMGPFSLADLIGLDVVVAILESLERRWGAKYHPAKTLYDLVSQGRLGKKTRGGFFKYGKEAESKRDQ